MKCETIWSWGVIRPYLSFVLAKYYGGLVKLRRGVSLIWLEFWRLLSIGWAEQTDSCPYEWRWSWSRNVVGTGGIRDLYCLQPLQISSSIWSWYCSEFKRIQLTPNLLSHETEKAKPRHSWEMFFRNAQFPRNSSLIHHNYLSLLASRSDSSRQRMSFSRTSQELVSRIPFIWQPSIRIFVPGPLTFRMMLLVVSSMNSTRTCVTPPREPVICQNSHLYSLRLNCVVSRYWIRGIVPRTSTSENYWISSVFTSE